MFPLYYMLSGVSGRITQCVLPVAFHDKNVVFLISFLLSWIWRLITVCTLNVCLQCEDINNRLLMELWTLVPGIEYLLSTVNASIYNLVNTGYTLVCGWIVELAYDISMYVVPKQHVLYIQSEQKKNLLQRMLAASGFPENLDTMCLAQLVCNELVTGWMLSQ